MATLFSLLKVSAVLIAAILIGNWYQSELKKMRAAGKQWYQIYTSLPGILILLALLLPVIVWIFRLER